MGLDQSIYDLTPDALDPFSYGDEISYWRKDWDLQKFINSENCENVPLTIEICDFILDHLDEIYEDKDDFDRITYTKQAFTDAKQLITEGAPLVYSGNW